MGLKVEQRPILEEELSTFEEAGACGTAAVISPIERIDDLERGTSYVFSKDGNPGPVCTKLYNKLRTHIEYVEKHDEKGKIFQLHRSHEQQVYPIVRLTHRSGNGDGQYRG